MYPTDPENFDEFYVVMEKADSDLKKIYKNNLSLDLVHIRTMLYNLLLALKYMHQSDIIHRDIKPANILVNENCTVKLCDYGLSRSIGGLHNTSDQIFSTKDVS